MSFEDIIFYILCSVCWWSFGFSARNLWGHNTIDELTAQVESQALTIKSLESCVVDQKKRELDQQMQDLLKESE